MEIRKTIQELKKNTPPADFNAISLKLASPEKILDWSFGEVTKPETINYRSGRAERGGLFDERIFGPERDYECYCGKYKRIRYAGIVCDKCGVEVTRSIVRRERMGHIELASPVAHIWFMRNIPSRLGLALGISISDLEKVIYFAGYIITSVNEGEKGRVLKEIDAEYKSKFKGLTNDQSKEQLKEAMSEAKRQVESLREWQVVDEITYHRLSLKYGSVFEAGIGAETLYDIAKSINVDQMIENLRLAMDKATAVERAKLQRRLNFYRILKRSGVRPEWMFLKVIPVIPPALRPMVALDGGRHATSDVNDLYRRVINRNNRLKKLVDLSAPEVILRNEKRILQEAVDALIDNSIRRGGGSEGVLNQAQRRPLKSLADSLRGKQGRFRQNLLGKRVDYSGRSVIVVGPELKISQCGLPKHMALELFRPFIISKILNQELAFNIRGAGRLIDEGIPEVWAILEEVIKDKHVLLNRAPTLHRLGIQAFQPVLIEGNAIQIHPLVCTAFNADFDGDQMAVHLPLSERAQVEARELIAANKNLLKPGSGDPVVNMKLDIVLGSYWVTKMTAVPADRIQAFSSPNQAIMAYDFGRVGLRDKIKLMGGKPEKYGQLAGALFETTVGRVLFNNTLPSDFPFLNNEVTSKVIGTLIEDLISRYGLEPMPKILDKIKSFGFKYATRSGITWGLDDVNIPVAKEKIIAGARVEVEQVENDYHEGLLSETERYRMVIEIWTRAKLEIQKTIPESLPHGGSAADILASGARGSIGQLTQMVGMKGIIINPAGQEIDFPIIPSYKEGLSPIEYFTTTHGSRKTLADTALNTAKAGYMTRKLVDVSQDVVIREEDCGDTVGRVITETDIAGFDTGIGRLVRGRILLYDLVGPDGKVLFKKGHLISREDAALIDKKGVTSAHIRSPLSCHSLRGVCQKCYGADPGRGHLVAIGEPVGIVAAQAIGEPGTQLTMRTKHSGGISTGNMDIVGGLPRVEEIFERRNPKNQAIISEVNGTILAVNNTGREFVIEVAVDPDSRKKKAKDNDKLEYSAPLNRTILVKAKDNIKQGQLLTDGSAELVNLTRYAGRVVAENYIIKEINAIYELQGVSISRKHIEVIIRQMFSRVKVKDPGDTKFTLGEVIERSILAEEHETLKPDSEKAKTEEILLGISEVALSTASFLSAASFQHTNKVLIDMSLKGGLDRLRGLKENVIIGRLIPAGTGLTVVAEKKEESEEATGDE
ncbi:MAG: DNA-directed RNA polymerase subunit beta' [Candidatus Vogelbacteria bacterium CG10_big_fil_rev_8_21_14_0_10_50_13]|uniref:DNA-directed RNA polymerase subunit beta' n=1 Tax=Candidatus Vogelbacteria bacterium CG10_big_fil_rev_8_21_14_0_10_50_13 TaxID=1975044 RepID=A0A2H0RFS8_9BACT|nr:MAG: DNA-directed RNA polymerase subunit beta' [Candidatus Vogelbacteria bacterium CG10_big_fil_rev_8_21_14_0_10_50_13]